MTSGSFDGKQRVGWPPPARHPPVAYPNPTGWNAHGCGQKGLASRFLQEVTACRLLCWGTRTKSAWEVEATNTEVAGSVSGLMVADSILGTSEPWAVAPP
ncbi:hypothetical protein GCM10022419_108910 [Nonomuraea rosea]|uniref:Uncharacterized protein n=1 Tax=Nonomuraea rosea TaxID=638574 RepID=A0ABP6ZDN7_9ACTN